MMIYNLRRKFVAVSAVSLITVLSLIFCFIAVMNHNQVSRSADIAADRLSAGVGDNNNGSQPEKRDEAVPPVQMQTGRMDAQIPFNTQYFSVSADNDGNIIDENIEGISNLSVARAHEYAKEAFSRGEERGWESDYRYKVIDTGQGKTVFFVDESMSRMMSANFLVTVAVVLVAAGLVVLIMIFFFSGRAVKPVAESYEKQKQFITNANHELKTPLTLIMANLDIIEMEMGKNEWLDDIRYEGKRMNKLVNQMVTLTRMDEDTPKLSASKFDISEMLEGAVSEFEMFAEERKKHIHSKIEEGIEYTGDEDAIKQVISILLDNAIKYCDENGCINIGLEKKKALSLYIENTCAEADNVELEKVFDRFYRSDKARTYNGGFGIGLSIARAIVQNHKGTIEAYKKEGIVGFKVVLKN